MSFESHKEVFEFVKTIPVGKVMNYGAIGRFVGMTGRQVGSIMGMSTPDIPWWRVVGHDGAFSIAKKDPRLEKEQRDRLMNEGVPIKENGKVNMMLSLWDGDF